jgi:dihydrofolate synthase/folylpolyglutamate synthase
MNEKYQHTLNYLYTQLPMFQRVGPKAFKKDLTNILALAESIGNPHENFPSIHLAGTNGKGSTAHMIAAVLQERGFKVGLYTSPHYRDFRERMKINGEYISKRAVVDFVEHNQKVFESIKPSFFEITVAMAFQFFANEKVDIAVIETGLGGRLDSTNIINPLLSIITNISFDHMNFLGDTLPLIAGEKAGIIKRNIPVVIGEKHPETEPVFLKKSRQENAPIYFAEDDLSTEYLSQNNTYTSYNIYKNGALFIQNLRLNLHGEYQAKNLITALKSISVLDEKYPQFNAKSESKKWSGLTNLKSLTNMIGRWEVLSENPMILCDSAHNIAGISAAMNQLRAMEFEQLHIVLGFVSDKPLNEVLELFPKSAKYYFAKPNIPRGLNAKKLKELVAPFGLKGRTYVSVKNALKAAKRSADKDDLIYVGGSIFVVAEVV